MQAERALQPLSGLILAWVFQKPKLYAQPLPETVLRDGDAGGPRFCVTAVGLDARHALLELNKKAMQDGLPVPNRHAPFLTDVVQCQLEQLEHCSVGFNPPPALVILRRASGDEST